MAHLRIFFALLGDPSPSKYMFPILVEPDISVGELKKLVHGEVLNSLHGIDARDLILWKLYNPIPVPGVDAEVATVRQNLSTFATEMMPGNALAFYFDTAPQGEHLHIIVQHPSLPSAGQKHGLSDDDTVGERMAKKSRVGSSDGSKTESDHEVRSEASLQQKVSDLHDKAWGKPWPQSEGTINKAEISDETGSADDDEIYGLADKLVVPQKYNYRYFKEIQSLRRALDISSGRSIDDILVVREEYETLCGVLEEHPEDSEDSGKSIVVAGHPGIGKSTFLLYLLLHRLEKELPTAVQFDVDYYFIFDKQGAKVNSLRHRNPRLEQCWALTDSNHKVLEPCTAFQSAKLVILASSPKPARWKEWIKQTGGRRIISDLPSVPEIAAIAKEAMELRKQLGKKPLYDPASTLSLVRMWGPSIRNVLRSMKFAASGGIDPIEEEVESAVNHISNNPSAIFEKSTRRMPQSEGSSVIFLRRGNNSVEWEQALAFIPTPHLLAMLEEKCRSNTSSKSLEVFYALSLHALTRGTAGWAHEKSVHDRLGTGGADLTIFRGPAEKRMQSSARLLPGTLDGLKEAGVADSFYWIPSAANFPGVDGVLGDRDGHVYTIQATIAHVHTSPIDGIRKVWKHFLPEVRAKRIWHYVVVTNTKQAADDYVDEFSKKLADLRLGGANVQVWAGVLGS